MADPSRSATHAARHEGRIRAALGEAAGWVADLGCGEGLFAGTVGKYVGLDLDLERARGARRRGIPAVVGDVERAPFKDGACGGVLCMNLLHGLPRPDRAVREIDRVLTPGGRAYLKNRWHKGGGDPSGFWARLARALHLHHFRFWNHFGHPAGGIFAARNADGTWGICPRCVRRFFRGRGYRIEACFSGQVFVLTKGPARA